jgi:hypothetical protein
MPVGRYWLKRLPGKPLPKRHPIEIRFGAPIQTDGEHRTEIMQRVRAFFERADTETTPAEPSRVLAGASAP